MLPHANWIKEPCTCFDEGARLMLRPLLACGTVNAQYNMTPAVNAVQRKASVPRLLEDKTLRDIARRNQRDVGQVPT